MIDAVRVDREATHVVRIQIADWICEDVKLLGLRVRKLAGNIREHILRGWFGIGGACALSGLGHMTLQGLNRDGAVFCCISVGEAWTGGEISCFDGHKPSGAHW